MNAITMNLTTIAALWLAGSVILIPLMIAAVRFAIVPLLETIGRQRSGSAPSSPLVEQRLALLEESLNRLAGDVERCTGRAAGHVS